MVNENNMQKKSFYKKIIIFFKKVLNLFEKDQRYSKTYQHYCSDSNSSFVFLKSS